MMDLFVTEGTLFHSKLCCLVFCEGLCFHLDFSKYSLCFILVPSTDYI